MGNCKLNYSEQLIRTHMGQAWIVAVQKTDVPFNHWESFDRQQKLIFNISLII